MSNVSVTVCKIVSDEEDGVYTVIFKTKDESLNINGGIVLKLGKISDEVDIDVLENKVYDILCNSILQKIPGFKKFDYYDFFIPVSELVAAVFTKGVSQKVVIPLSAAISVYKEPVREKEYILSVDVNLKMDFDENLFLLLIADQNTEKTTVEIKIPMTIPNWDKLLEDDELMWDTRESVSAFLRKVITKLDLFYHFSDNDIKKLINFSSTCIIRGHTNTLVPKYEGYRYHPLDGQDLEWSEW